MVWALRVIITGVIVSGDLTWGASGNGWPLLLKLNLGSIKMVGSLGVIVARMIVCRDLSWGASSDRWPGTRELNSLRRGEKGRNNNGPHE